MSSRIRKRRRGIAILISLFMAILVTMFVTAMVTLFPQQMESAQSSREGVQALSAARTGLEYAWNRLQENPSWRGDLTGNASGYTINTPPLSVYEDHGNVWGFLTSPEGDKSQFRIRFNYQNSGSPSQTLSGPGASYTIDSPFVSFNNLNSATSAVLYRGENSSGHPVTGATLAPYSVPMFSCALIVEGRAGDGMRDTTTGNPNPVSNGRRVVTRVLEANLSRPSMSCLDAAIYGGSITSFIGSGHTLDVESKVPSTPPAMRSLGNIGLGSSTYQTSSTGRVFLPTTSTFSAGSGGTAPTQIAQSKSTLQNNFLKLKSTDVAKARPAVDATLPAGTYVWRSTGVVDYYAQEYDGSTVPSGSPAQTFSNTAGFTSFMSGAGGIGPGLADPVVMDPATYTLKLQKNTYVAPVGAVKGLAIVPEAGLTAAANRPKNIFEGIGGVSAPVLTSTGNITLEGALIGKGSLTSDQNIKFQGPSVFETDPNRSVSLFAKGNIDLQRTPDPVVANLGATGVDHPSLHHQNHNSGGDGSDGDENAQAVAVQTSLGLTPFSGSSFMGSDVLVGGLIYAGGNFTVDLTPSTAGLPQGSFYLRGAAVSYGNNTDAGELPGAPGTGVNFANAANAQVFYDPAYVMQSVTMSAPSRLTMTLLTQY